MSFMYLHCNSIPEQWCSVISINPEHFSFPHVHQWWYRTNKSWLWNAKKEKYDKKLRVIMISYQKRWTIEQKSDLSSPRYCDLKNNNFIPLKQNGKIQSGKTREIIRQFRKKGLKKNAKRDGDHKSTGQFIPWKPRSRSELIFLNTFLLQILQHLSAPPEGCSCF